MIELEVDEYIYPNGEVGLKNFKNIFQGKEFIFGNTGSGKSTILKIISGIIPKVYGGNLKGFVRIFGNKPSCKESFYLSQRIEETVTCEKVIEEIAFPLVQMGYKVFEAKKIAEEICEELKIGHLLYRKTREISTGELQLVEIASAIASSKILLLDEPFAHLSKKNAERLLKILEDYFFIIAEHRIELAKSFNAVNLGLKVEEVEVPEVDLGEVIYEPLNLKEKEILAVVGENGAGKTTFLKKTARNMKKLSLDFSFVPQHPAYYLTKRVKDECGKFLKDFELERFSERHSQSLSYGQMRRVAIAKAFRSKILLLDEPTAGQDINFRFKLLKLIKTYKKTAIIATHDEKLADLCDRKLKVESA
ncbi:MAG: ATP-binding cassette domain-containing protein [Archaeoglobaceae archaeon]|nr:ATP-binding cassette domain-containing protein [Archaeoglobaceae archaeon]MCX8152651.1 ATP-binding cassette domain-containing protein [Archaeoglobaceae archaeon]MDW8014067.1 ATP-binding cassette domain-containing protein [Archaeoglobaceae archaeon]